MMTDYKEEQSNEIEALESIYPNEFQILETSPFHKFKIIVKSEEYDNESEDPEGAAVDLIFEYTKCYPDEPPIMEVCSVYYIEDDDLDDLKTKLEEQCLENLGMVMVFTLVSFTLEWLNNKIEEDKRKADEEKLLQKKAEEEKERKKFEGTRVTVESFLAWKKEFDFKKLLGMNKEKDDERSKKLTGKELFLKDETLIESDLSFLGIEDEVSVDESLFQDLDDLDLGDDVGSDDEFDEDYVPDG